MWTVHRGCELFQKIILEQLPGIDPQGYRSMVYREQYRLLAERKSSLGSHDMCRGARVRG